jgi:hypothetical protein
MDEWQILRPSAQKAESLGFVRARTEADAIKEAVVKFNLPDASGIVAVRVITPAP